MRQQLADNATDHGLRVERRREEELRVLPTLILFGLVFGRWWRLSLITAALGWPVLLVATDVMRVEPGLLAASGLAIANTGVGVVIHQGIRRTIRKLRHSGSSPSEA